MIQRIQSIYLTLTIALLSVITFGITIFNFVGSKNNYRFNAFGIQTKDLLNEKTIDLRAIPLYLLTIGLVLLTFLTLMSYKKLARQLKLVRLLMFVYLIAIISLLVFYFIGENLITTEQVKRELGLGYLLFICGFPLVFLANIAIKRDKNLIDSLNRLR